MTPAYLLFINGEFKDSPNKQKIINPSTGEIIAEVAIASEKDTDSAIEAAHLAFDKGPWPRISLEERKDFILKISKGVLDKAGELAKL